MFLIFIPLFLLIPCVLYFMDLSLCSIAGPTRFEWEPVRPDFGLTRVRHTGFTSHMRAIQVNPVAVARHRTRPSVARAFPVRRYIDA